jgi:molybdate transport system substrate-binding protein
VKKKIETSVIRAKKLKSIPAEGLYMLRILLMSLLVFGVQIPVAVANSPLIAAASSLRYVMPRLEQAFKANGGSKLRVSFGSSGNLSRQILQGAPHELFLSADTSYVSALIDAGLTKDKGQIYAYGRLALIATRNSKLMVDRSLEGLKTALVSGGLKRFAIANPQFAPYGRAAMQVLKITGLWQDIQPLLVFGENIAQTAQFAISSAAQGGLVSYSLALAPAVAAKTKQALVPASWHQPLKHQMVLLKNASHEAMDFYKFMRSDTAQDILARNGFSAVN